MRKTSTATIIIGLNGLAWRW